LINGVRNVAFGAPAKLHCCANAACPMVSEIAASAMENLLNMVAASGA
jgi:hypothetical protein